MPGQPEEYLEEYVFLLPTIETLLLLSPEISGKNIEIKKKS